MKRQQPVVKCTRYLHSCDQNYEIFIHAPYSLLVDSNNVVERAKCPGKTFAPDSGVCASDTHSRYRREGTCSVDYANACLRQVQSTEQMIRTAPHLPTLHELISDDAKGVGVLLAEKKFDEAEAAVKRMETWIRVDPTFTRANMLYGLATCHLSRAMAVDIVDINTTKVDVAKVDVAKVDVAKVETAKAAAKAAARSVEKKSHLDNAVVELVKAFESGLSETLAKNVQDDPAVDVIRDDPRLTKWLKTSSETVKSVKSEPRS
jgi:hypothetical protein